MLFYLASEHQVKCLSVQCCNSLNAGKALNVLDNEEGFGPVHLTLQLQL